MRSFLAPLFPFTPRPPDLFLYGNTDPFAFTPPFPFDLRDRPDSSLSSGVMGGHCCPRTFSFSL